MREEQWQATEALFHRLLSTDPSARRRALDDCTDPVVQQAVINLLEADARADCQLEAPHRIARDWTSAAWSAGHTVGPWLIGEEIGRGGMGVVFAAERCDGEPAPPAAIKLLRGFPDVEGLDRFARERRVLSRLDHPNIVRLIDAGSTVDGQPYMVMTRVDGDELETWCRKASPSISERLRLFLDVTDAVTYAHGELVLHRDLKPANILVDRQGHPRLVDFGVAALLPAGEASQTSGIRYRTQRYASPEFAHGLPVGVATDVYSLGVILGELLADAPPRWRRELDAIVRKAARDEPALRYPSVAALGDDVRRLRDGEPVRATNGGWRYRSAKFIRRQRYAVAATVAIVATVTLFTIGLVQQRDRARQAEAVARSEADVARRTASLLTDLFESADPFNPTPSDLSVRSVLDRALPALAAADNDPKVRARLLHTIATIYRNLGLPDAAEAAWEQAEALQRSLGEMGEAAVSAAELAMLHSSAREIDRALLASARALSAADGLDDPEVNARVTLAHAVALEAAGRLDQARPVFLQALAVADTLPTDREPWLARIHTRLGDLAASAAQPSEAAQHFTAARETLARIHGEQSAALFAVDLGLARALRDQGQSDAAAASFETILQKLDSGAKNSATAVALFGDYGSTLHDLGRYPAARAAYRNQLRLAAEVYGAKSPQVAIAQNNLAALSFDEGDFASAIAGLRQSLALRAATQPPNSLPMARIQGNLGDALVRVGKVEEGRRLLEQAFATRLALLGPTHFETIASRVFLGNLALAEGNAENALAQLRAIAASGAVLERFDRMIVLRLAGQVALAMGDAETARSQFADARDLMRTEVGAGHPDTAKLEVKVAATELALGNVDAARAALARARPVLEAVLHRDAPLRYEMAALAAELDGSTAGAKRSTVPVRSDNH